MKVLIAEQVRGAAMAVAQQLGAAGHLLAYCHAPDNKDVCVGLRPGGRCPLAGFDVDVVVDARVAETEFTEKERGAMCAVRQAVPVVVAGPVPERSTSPWREADVVCLPHDVVDACERAVTNLGATPHRAVAAAISRVLRQVGNSQQSTVVLRKQQHAAAVDVFITTDHALTTRVREAVRVAVRGALAAYTPHWLYAQVIFRDHGVRSRG